MQEMSLKAEIMMSEASERMKADVLIGHAETLDDFMTGLGMMAKAAALEDGEALRLRTVAMNKTHVIKKVTNLKLPALVLLHGAKYGIQLEERYRRKYIVPQDWRSMAQAQRLKVWGWTKDNRVEQPEKYNADKMKALEDIEEYYFK